MHYIDCVAFTRLLHVWIGSASLKFSSAQYAICLCVNFRGKNHCLSNLFEIAQCVRSVFQSFFLFLFFFSIFIFSSCSFRWFWYCNLGFCSLFQSTTVTCFESFCVFEQFVFFFRFLYSVVIGIGGDHLLGLTKKKNNRKFRLQRVNCSV